MALKTNDAGSLAAGYEPVSHSVRGSGKSVVIAITVLPMKHQMKNIFLMPMLAGFIA